MQGNARYAMWGIISGALLNVVLDPILIFGCGLQLRGAAIATVIGQIVSVAVLLAMCHFVLLLECVFVHDSSLCIGIMCVR